MQGFLWRLRFLAVFSLPILWFACCPDLGEAPDGAQRTKSDVRLDFYKTEEGSAIAIARQAVRAAIEPRRARFPLPESGAYAIAQPRPGRYTVTGYVDAKNAFSVECRSPWRVVVEHINTEESRVLYLELDGTVIFDTGFR